jgi:DNA-binding CsgD family transcriptional regulator
VKRDFINVIEAAYDEESSERDWVAAICEAARPALDEGLGLAAFTFELPHKRPIWKEFVAVGGDAEAIVDCHRGILAEAPADVIVHGFNVNLASSLSSFRDLRLNEQPYVAPHLALCGACDSMGIVAYDPRGAGVCLSVLFPEEHALSASTHRTWMRIAAHLGAGLRLRRRDTPETAEAVLDPGGKLYDASGDARDRDAQVALRQAARAIDRAKARRTTDPDEAVGAWRALVAGQWSLVDRFESDGRHFLIARQNKLGTAPVRPLSERERQVATLAARGRSNKLIAYELGLAVGTVSTLLTRAARKLGVGSRTQLIAEWQRLEREADERGTA